jgi:hypothetical protein
MTLTDEIKIKKRKKYQKRVFFLLRSLYPVFLGSALNIQMVDQYQKIYRPLTDHADGDRLPFKSKGKLAIKKKRSHCLFAMLNNVIVNFWSFCEDQENEVDLLSALIETEDIVTTGLESYRVTGTTAEGFYLVK